MNNDLISRSALKKKIEPLIENDRIYDVLDYIDNAPTVDAIPNEEGYEMYNKGYMSGYERGKEKRPQGKWIEHYSKEMSEKGYFLCSKCKCGFQRFARGVRHSDLPWIDGQKYELHYIDNFCPNCGADMRKEKKA